MCILQYHIGECRICGGYGQLIVIYNIIQCKCSIICNECLAEWSNPIDALQNKNGYRKLYKESEARNATKEEITNAGWGKYIIGNTAYMQKSE